MKQRCLIILSSLFLATLVLAQTDYSSDAVFLRQDGAAVVLESSGVHAKRKEALPVAARSAIHTLLLFGIEGVGDGSSLIPKSQQEKPEVVAYIGELLETDRYNIFIKEVSEIKGKGKTLGKSYRVVAEVSIYNEGLYRDLVKNKLIPERGSTLKLDDIEDRLAQMPSIMVLPYRKNGKDYQALLKDKNVRMAITSVDQEFLTLGVNTKNYETVLDKISASSLLDSPTQLEDMLLSQSGADVYVTVDFESETNSAGTMINMSLRAAETGSGRNLAAQQLNSARLNTTNIASICTALSKTAMPNFLKQITLSFSKKVATGLSLSIEVTVDENVGYDLSERVGARSMPIKLLIKDFIRKNAKDGKYETNGETNTRMQFDRVFVSGKTDAFGDDLSMFLFDNGVANKTTLIDNTLRVVIN